MNNHNVLLRKYKRGYLNLVIEKKNERKKKNRGRRGEKKTDGGKQGMNKESKRGEKHINKGEREEKNISRECFILEWKDERKNRTRERRGARETPRKRIKA